MNYCRQMAGKCLSVFVGSSIPVMCESTTPPLGVVAPLDGEDQWVVSSEYSFKGDADTFGVKRSCD
jgi:hypothetical protein